MENTAYGPSPIPQHPAAALVAFSQANSLSEALRLRQFPQSTDGKDLGNPFSAASLLRPSDAAVAAAAGLAAHHHGLAWPLFNLQHPFFHPSIDPRFGPGAFRPLGPAAGDDQLKPYHPFGAAGLSQQQQQQQQQQASPVHHQQKGLIGGSGGTGSAPAGANSGGGGGKLAEGLQAFNLSRYNPLFGSLESSLAAGRLVFGNGGAHQQHQLNQLNQLRVIQGEPESPNHNNRSAASASPPGTGTMAPGADSSDAPSGRDAAATPSSDAGTDPRSTPDDVRSSRRRKKSPLDPSCCPVCGITLRSADLEAHFVQELERLERVSRSFRSPPGHHGHHSPSAPVGTNGGALAAPAATSQVQKREQDTRWETFHRIRINRANRIRVKGRKRRADECDDTPERRAGSSGVGSGTPCPVCAERMHGTPDELNQHVVRCLRRQNGEDPDDDEPLDVEGDSYEEYEWAGQRRIRATSMLEGGFAAAGMQICKVGDEENEDVVVDGDDTATFGPSQFAESDIQMAAAEQCSLAEDANIKTEREFAPLSFKETDSKDHIINALKSRVNDLEEMNKEAKQKNRCLICLGDYRKPVVSTSCWHVHCEECWLQALGNKKLCPQCNLITSPTHLRRIYM